MSILLNSNNVWIPNLDYFLESKTSDVNLNEGKYLNMTENSFTNKFMKICKCISKYVILIHSLISSQVN